MKDLRTAIQEKQASIEQHKADIRRLEKDIEALNAAIRVLEGEEEKPVKAAVASVPTPTNSNQIRRVFP